MFYTSTGATKAPKARAHGQRDLLAIRPDLGERDSSAKRNIRLAGYLGQQIETITKRRIGIQPVYAAKRI